MKKIYILIVLMITVFLTACSSSNLKTISYNNLVESINNKESFILYFSTSDSNNLQETLENVLKKYDVKGYRIDISKLSNDEVYDLKLKFSYNDPSIIFVKDGKDTGVLSHITDTTIKEKNIIKRLIDMNYIKEE